jgi:hypothetical protein
LSSLIVALGGSTATLLYIVIYFLKNPEKAKLWAAYLARFLSWFKASWDKKAVADEIEARNEDFKKIIENESEENILPYQLKVKWVDKEEKKDAFIKKGKAVIKMYHHNNQEKNFTYTIIDYLTLTLIPNSQLYVDDEVMKAAEYTMAEKFFIVENRHKSLKLFNEEFIKCEEENNSNIYRYYDTLRKLDEGGFFTRIFLRDLYELGELYPTGIHTNIKDETKEYTRKLSNLANRKIGEEIDCDFKGKYIKSAIVFIAKYSTYEKLGIDPYIKHIYKRYVEGFTTIYLFAKGDKISIAEEITDKVEKDRKFIKLFHKYFDLIDTERGSRKGVYIVFKRI